MEKLVIKNFLCIEDAEIEIKKINLFIGPQAQGKSLISKLICFFKEYPQTLVEGVYRDVATKDDCDDLALIKFEKFFPKYTWQSSEFKISYSNKYYSVSISNRVDADKEKNYSKLILDSNFIVRNIFLYLKEAKEKSTYIQRQLDDNQAARNLTIFQGEKKRLNLILSGAISFLEGVLIDTLFEKNSRPYLERVFYIPAGRSFFANLDKSIFSFLSSEIKIDYFLIQFGKIYEQVRHDIKFYSDINVADNIVAEHQKKRIEELVTKIICGGFIFEGGRDWIVNNESRIDIADASSGQQEALPMAVLLSIMPYISSSHKSPHFIIEEPETHLFPIAQNEIVQLIANAYNYEKTDRLHNISSFGVNSFTIATHSPYILTAFNNLIQAGNVAASKNYQDLDKLREIVPESEWVDFNDVTAYVVDNGTVKSILNQELKLIDANMIDEVSDYLADKFRELLSMEVIDD